MAPFITMVFVGLAAGLLVPALAIVAAKLGICETFSLQIAGHRWTFSKNRHVASANTAYRFEAHMVASHAHREYGRSSSSTFYIKLAA